MPPKKGKREQIAERRRIVWEWKKAGYTVRAIRAALEKLEPPIVVSTSTVQNDIKRTLEGLKKETFSEAESWRALLTSRYEELLAANWQKAVKEKDPDRDAVRDILRILAQEKELWVPKVLDLRSGDEPFQFVSQTVVHLTQPDETDDEAERDG